MNTPMRTIQDVKNLNAAAGNHFFEASTMRFFNSTIYSEVYLAEGNRVFFVTSERYGEDHPRFYSVRVADPSGRVSTISGFQEHATKDSAIAAAKAAAAK